MEGREETSDVCQEIVNIFLLISKMDVYFAGLTISVWHVQLMAALLVKFLYSRSYSGFDKLCHSKRFNW